MSATNILDVLSITGVVFILIGAGYLSVLVSVFSGAELATLGKFVLNFALPALIIHAMTSRPIGEVISASYLGAYLFGSAGAFVGRYVIADRRAGAQPIEGTFDGMGMSCANSGFVGYPILLMAMPAIAPTVLALNMIIENLIKIPLVLIMAERATGGGRAVGALPARSQAAYCETRLPWRLPQGCWCRCRVNRCRA